jgi:hypothetical protein
MHDKIVGGLGTVGTGDAWLRANIDPYVEWARNNNSLLIVTFDEDDHSLGNQIPTLFVGPMVKPGQYSEAVDHFSVLRTVEDMYQLPYAGASASATSIADIWADPSVPTVSIAATAPNADEASQVPGTFTVTRTGDPSNDLTVNYLVGGTAVNGTDYTAISTSVTIPAGASSQTITVTPMDDQAVVGNQTVVLSLLPDPNGTYYVSADRQATVTIADDTDSTTTLIATGSTWKYLDIGSNQGTAWRTRTFNDSSWQSGAAQLGYGAGNETTVVGYGPDANNKYTTTYFRQSFNVANKATFSALQLSLLRTDGAVVYLNGVEVFRSDMPGGTVNYKTRASFALLGSEESSFVQASLNPALLVNGTNVLAVEIHQANRTSPDLNFDLKLTGQAATATLTQPGSEWKYLGNGSNQGTAWRSRTFNDSAWTSGPAKLGYGVGDERTVVNSGPDPNNEYITTYFRITFYAANVASFNGLLLRLLGDDGAVVYLNGAEVYRNNMPNGTVGYRTLASTEVTGANASAFTDTTLSRAKLVNGKNVLAVEVHQASPNGPDLGFDLALLGQP